MSFKIIKEETRNSHNYIGWEISTKSGYNNYHNPADLYYVSQYPTHFQLYIVIKQKLSSKFFRNFELLVIIIKN